MNIWKYKLQLRFRHAPPLNHGFTLIETMVAVTVLLITLIGLITLAALSLRSFSASKENFVAGKIAQEGMELMLNKRENNLLCMRAGTCTLSCASGNDWRKHLLRQEGVSCTFNAQDWEVDATKPDELLAGNDFQTFNTGSPRKICRQASGAHAGKFKQCVGTETPIPGNYTRRVRAEPIVDCSRIRVQSIVEWTGRFGPKQLILEEVLFGVPAPTCADGGGGTPSSEGLVAHWELDEESGTFAADSSGNNNNGTLVGGPTWIDGQIGNAAQFDGVNDHVQIEDSNSLDVSAITVSAWIYRTADTPSQYQAVVSRQLGSANSDVIWLGICPPTGFICSSTHPNGISFGLSVNGIRGPSNTPLNQWIHVVGTSDATEMKIYINGEWFATGPGEIAIPETSLICIGGGANNATRLCQNEFFQGSIDDVRVYNRALAQDEIAALYDEGANP
jgi:Tfp pilus assembly protein PilV